jgi:hypothetical protein
MAGMLISSCLIETPGCSLSEPVGTVYVAGVLILSGYSSGIYLGCAVLLPRVSVYLGGTAVRVTRCRRSLSESITYLATLERSCYRSLRFGRTAVGISASSRPRLEGTTGPRA